ncbi:hypothetical protein CAC42_6910 [Sphaceloma murrayae]|uniref:Uncharacterized protein n=1 Tax=Sphaceloma murrayae TaxID=2082308 RepID=A0A2K1QQ60_9PEZI|nr:hypothetical protein CAC42_6910 [Sphaceloma murrayae]
MFFHARQAAPDALEPITDLALRFISANYFNPPSASRRSARDAHYWKHKHLEDQREFRALTNVTNALLAALAKPCRIQPFKSVRLQEAAQVRIVRFMATHVPSIDLNRHGYRSIVSVQLMLRKTSNELRWARLQALSWPPWKEDKTGMDTHIGPEAGRSNAFEALSRMKEVGYTMRGWEMVATAYSGWDTDGSPTVQTRQYLGPFDDWQAVTVLWASRIRTTRTLREAWAAFQAYQTSGCKLRAVPCQAMIERILFAMKREVEVKAQFGERYDHTRPHRLAHTWRPGQDEQEILPGEAREIRPSPPSAHQEIYTRTPPPTLIEFLQLMDEHKVTFDAGALCHLLPLVGDWDSGVALLRRSRHAPLRKTDSIFQLLTSYERLPASLLLIICQFLLHFPAKYVSTPRKERGHMIRIDHVVLNNTALALTFGILRNQQTYDGSLPAFMFMTMARQAGLAKYDAPAVELATGQTGLVCMGDSFGEHAAGISMYKPHLDRMTSLRLALELLATTRERQQTVAASGVSRLLLIGFNAAQAARDVLIQVGDRMSQHNSKHLSADGIGVLVKEAKACLEYVSAELRPQFFALYGEHATRPLRSSEDPSSSFCLSLALGPTGLHAAVRCFGAANDMAGVVQLIHFMHNNWDKLAVVMEQDRGGKAMLRKTMCAARLFLDIGWDAFRRDWSHHKVLEAFQDACTAGQFKSGKQRDKMRNLVRGMKAQWGGWPTTEDVEMYILNSKAKTKP